jgi:hypothetical protein
MKTLFFIIVPIFLSNSFTEAQALVEFGPVAGIEKVWRQDPTPHHETQLFYGARLVAGLPILSLEAEATASQGDENYPQSDYRLQEQAYTGKLGLRSSPLRGSLGSWYVRAGGHMRKSEFTETRAGVTTTRTPATKISPYAGTGLRFHLSKNIRFQADITAIFTDRKRKNVSDKDRDYQATFAIQLGL